MDGILIVGPIIFLVVIVFFYLVPLGLWIQTGVSIGWGKVGMIKLVVMRIRKIPPKLISDGVINLHRAGLDYITSEDLETHFLAGGNIINVVDALIAADKANIELTFQTAAAIDLAGRDVKEAVQTSVYPKVINCPKEGKVSAVSKDGIQLHSKARVTVRTNIDQLVGGATDDTVIARVGEGIVSAIGSAKSYKSVLENPDDISRAVLSKGLDSGTAYSILSIDIADVDVGNNVGAHLEADQAEADKKVAQAKAESRRAMAVAAEQEMQAKVQEMQAKVVEAEAEVPKAMAQAFREGNLGIMDYYNMQNVKSDTKMRDSIAGQDSEEKTNE
ncbi:MAG: flotillin-like protein FloA [Candidatus Marinimicrobia bacterium]|nr:flotillin-like protein FloA [Candidatus Neomarinimicrobiota bacterium]MBL7022597.1 flotillin-like protein FloA [Candidatus Neomarinimicrobiota bacterium]MBL7109868.1 flotillin-like protein FloA [Candidatus Neomarinimicrobiota bacterium]